jgi:acyl-CoA synthetase (AMP-forming)/AMP-acid ligase II/NAD(P)-dependent dehydrogenase (short-subunit alcohol dehydrogenase family)/acyl carrier protein
MSDASTDLSRLETALLNDPSVYDCAVRWRADGNGRAKVIAYVVPARGFSRSDAEARLRMALAADLMPEAYVLLSALPLNTDGQIDDQVLATFQVLDRAFAQSCEERILRIPGITQAAAVVEDQRLGHCPLHISDLLPDGDVTRAPALTPTVCQLVATENAHEPKKPALSDGGPLRSSEGLPSTLPQALKRASATPNGITYLQADGSETRQSYRELLKDAKRILGGLRKLGLKPTDPVIFQLDRNQDFIPAFWACMLGGFLPAPISIAPAYKEANSTVSKLCNCWELLDRPLVLTGAGLVREVASVAKLLGIKGFRVQNIAELRANPVDHRCHKSQPGDICLLLFTSGSTGHPKGVQQSHQSLLARSAATAEMNHFDERDISINWFPLDHVGGLVMFHLMDVFTCASQVQVPTEPILQEPLKWLDLIERFRATITWAPNFAFGLVNEREKEIAAGHWDLSTMRFVLNGGEAIVAKTARRFLELLEPHGLRSDAMHPSWGMSETCSGVVFSERCRRDIIRDEDAFVEVGAPIPGISLRIVDHARHLLEEGQIGSLQVKGLPVTSGYYKNLQLNREAFSPDDWFDTGDLAFLHEDLLTITGRTKDVIIVNGVNFYSHELEAFVESVEGIEVSFTAACPVRVSGANTERLAIFFSTALHGWPNLLALMNAIRETLLRKTGVHPDYLVPLAQADIPKTAIGKIQRSLLREKFEAGEFTALLKEIDIHSANGNTVPDWFYRKEWRRRELDILNAERRKGNYLIFVDGLGLAELVCAKLTEEGARIVRVDSGAAFSQLTGERYVLNPKSAGDYHRLIEALEKQGIMPDHVVHLWAYDQTAAEPPSMETLREAQHRGAYSLLRLLQALANRHVSLPTVRLFAVTAHAQLTPEQEQPISPERATISGLLATCSLELPWIECRHIDLETVSCGRNVEYLLRELASPKRSAEVVYRNGQRLIASLRKIDMLRGPVQPLPIEEGGLYLITGGLGGVGTELALHLVQKYRAKLIFTGRTSIPPRLNWDRLDGGVARRVRNFQRIEQAGGEFDYYAFDLSDSTSIRTAIAQAEAKYQQPLRGVFHLAGSVSGSDTLDQHWKSVEQHWIVTEQIENFETVFGSKVYGTWALFEALRDRSDVLCVVFSSLNALFGAAALSAYSAANSFLDCVSLSRRHSPARTYCFDWSMWNDLGISESSPGYARQIARNMGYHVVSKEQGILSLSAALARQHRHVLIGIDGASAHIRKYVTHDVQALSRLAAYYVGEEGFDDEGQEHRFAELQSDSTHCCFVPLPHIPLTASGEIDRARLASMDGQTPAVTSEITEARDFTEEQVSKVWCDVLAQPQISIDQSFFELGGDSLTGIRLIHRLREIFQVNLSVRTLFENPTIPALAKRIVEATASQQIGSATATVGSALNSASELLSSLNQLSDAEVEDLLAGMSSSEFPQ